MSEKRYRYDTGCIIDQKTGEILSERQVVIRLNKQDAIIESEREAVKFHVDGYNHVIQTINEALSAERTELGKSVLKQLLDQME